MGRTGYGRGYFVKAGSAHGVGTQGGGGGGGVEAGIERTEEGGGG